MIEGLIRVVFAIYFTVVGYLLIFNFGSEAEYIASLLKFGINGVFSEVAGNLDTSFSPTKGGELLATIFINPLVQVLKWCGINLEEILNLLKMLGKHHNMVGAIFLFLNVPLLWNVLMTLIFGAKNDSSEDDD